SGRCELVSQAFVERINSDAAGHADGMTYIDTEGRRHSPRAEVAICPGGAIGTARLLLNSASAHDPHGLGNAHDQVGRNLQGHFYPSTVGLLPEIVHDGIGPGVTTATVQFNHGNVG